MACLLGLWVAARAPDAQAQVPVAAPAADPTRAGPDASPRFDILEFVVAGDTVLGAAAIERAVYAFLGPGRTVADAEGARRALEKAYQDAGFLSVNVVLPQQRVDNAGGEVRLQVVEAPVDNLRVTGARFHLPSQVREAMPSLAPGTVPNFNEMQQELSQLARTSADREITPILAAGVRPATLDVELKVQDTLPLHGSIELNDKRSPNTRAGRLEAAISYDNLFQRGHSIGLNWFAAPRRLEEADIRSLGYHFPLGGEGDRLFLAFVDSDSNTPTPIGGATVSRGQILRARWRDELTGIDLPERRLSHGLSWGLTVRNLRDRNRDVAGADTPSPPLRYGTLNLAYDLSLSGSAPGRSSRLQAELALGPRGLNRKTIDCFGGEREQFACKRSQAEPGFETYGVVLSHREPLGRWALSGRLSAQLADAPLVPSEQVVFGGHDSVRGFDEGEQAGDSGAALRLELFAPPWAPSDRLSISGFGFYDRATLRRLEPLPSELVTTQLASAGLGLRFDTTFGLQASLLWARVLQDSARQDGNGLQPPPAARSSNGRARRWDFSVRQAF